ncbi:MAG: PdxA family protein [Oligoflexales bacterium]
MLVCTLGDPNSVNIELFGKVLEKTFKSEKLGFPLILIGSYQQWAYQKERLGFSGSIPEFIKIPSLEHAKNSGFFFIDVGGINQDPRTLSLLESGKIAKASLDALEDFAPNNKLAVLTCPIDKLACNKAGFRFTGQTEYFEFIWEGSAIMTLAGDKLKVGLACNHLPLSKVSSSLNSAKIYEKILKFGRTLEENFGIVCPRIAVCGLNPHCGEGGLLGYEDQELIEPAVDSAAASSSFNVTGPVSADTVFWQALQGTYDGVLAMYHDQGLGPLKTVHFDSAINISGGLKHLRVSPDHGPARDLVFKNQASSRSFEIAWETCMQYLRG